MGEVGLTPPPAQSSAATIIRGGSEGATPPASLARGHKECGHGEYAANPQ